MLKNTIKLSILVLILLLAKGQALSQDDDIFYLGAGEVDQQYDLFAKALAREVSDANGLKIEVINTRGSTDAIRWLSEGTRDGQRLDAAIVQNDIAFLHSNDSSNTAPREVTELRGMVELFPEYVQVIVRADGTVKSVSDLAGKTVSVGLLGSGAERNASQILDAYGLRKNDSDLANVSMVNYSTEEGLQALASDSVSAVFMTGKFQDLSTPLHFETNHSSLESLTNSVRLQHLSLDKMALKDLTDQYSYFRVKRGPSVSSASQDFLTVTAYIVTTDSLSKAKSNLFLDGMYSGWNELRISPQWRNRLPRLQDILQRRPVEWHDGVRTALRRQNVLPAARFNYWLIAAWATIIAVSLYAVNSRAGYNRLGIVYSKQADRSVHQFALNVIARLAPAVLGLSLFFFLIIFAVACLKFFEEHEITTGGSSSAFLTLGWWDSFVWMFQYVASGFQGDARAPQSDAGKLISAAVAIIGVLGPTTLIFYVVNMLNVSRQRKLAGLSDISKSNPVVICGWNEKGPGIVYSLTGDDVDERMHVSIVADLGDSSPVERYSFNTSQVTYIRGDETETTALLRANADKARVAIILADYDDRSSDAMASVLTAMNLRTMSSSLHICAELARQQDHHFFTACGCDSLIVPDLLVTKLAASAVVDPLLIDFIVDVITYHEFDEFYTASPTDIKNATGKSFVGHTMRDIELEFLKRGTNVVGLIRGARGVKGLYDADFGGDSYVRPMTSAADSRITFSKDDLVVYSGRDRRALKSRNHAKKVKQAKLLDASEFQIPEHEIDRVLLIGDSKEADDIEASLTAFAPDVEVISITANSFEQALPQLSTMDFSHIISLVDKADREQASSIDAVNRIDASTILTVRRILHHFGEERFSKIQVVAEILNINNRKVFMNAGVTSVVPTALLVERLLVKEVYDPSYILDYIVALLNMQDGTHLATMTIAADHPLLGKTYHSVLKTEVDGLRIVGWLPKNQLDTLRNKQDDFDWHFRTVLDQRMQQNKIVEGDKLIIIYNRDEYLRGAAKSPMKEFA